VDVLGPFQVIGKPLTLGAARASDEATAKAGPLIWWKLDETTGGTAANAAGQAFVGTIHGEPRWASGQGANAGALEFDGAKNRVEAKDSEMMDFRDALTVATWVKVRKWNGADDTLLSKGEALRLERRGGQGGVEFIMRGPKLAKAGPRAASQSEVRLNGKRKVDDGEWHHVVVTYNGTRAALYVDGEEEAAVDAAGVICQNNLPVTIGDNSALGRCFNGWMDDTRLYARGLTAEEVKELAKRTVTVTSVR